MKRSVGLSEEDLHELMEESMGKRTPTDVEEEMDEDLDR